MGNMLFQFTRLYHKVLIKLLKVRSCCVSMKFINLSKRWAVRMKRIVLGMGLLIAGTIGLSGFFLAVFKAGNGADSPMLYVYGLLSIIGLIVGLSGLKEQNDR